MSRRIRTYKKLKNSFGSVTYVTKIEWQNNKSFSFGKIESVEKKLEKKTFLGLGFTKTRVLSIVSNSEFFTLY
jgi:hypothetical protein